jgi:hypothetical protein
MMRNRQYVSGVTVDTVVQPVGFVMVTELAVVE